MRTFALVTLGCKVNRVESDSFADKLKGKGMHETSFDRADLVIINTCLVTAEAEKKTRKRVRHVLSANQHAQVIVTGCASALSPQLYASLDPRVQVVPKAEVLQALEEAPVVVMHEEGASVDIEGRTRRGVKVQDGCDNACTYCIVCKARGASVSRPSDEVVNEVSALVGAGVKEIVLTGINIGAYDQRGLDLSRLIERVLDEVKCEEEPSFRLRLSSIEPVDITDELIDLVARSEGRICRHFHIPLQSGSSRILEAMARNYDAPFFDDLVGRIRARIPNASITTDIIAGFPGEQDEDFEETCLMARRSAFSKMHVFPFSAREGTIAAHLPEQVAASVKQARSAHLRHLSEELRRSDAQSRRGSSELYLIQDGGTMMSESYYEVAAPAHCRAGELYESAFVLPPDMVECQHGSNPETEHPA